MGIPRLRADQTALLVVDVQERLMPSIVDGDRVIGNAAILLRMAAAMNMPYLVTEQYPHGLGRTVDHVAKAMTDQSRRIEKTRFSACIDLVQEQLLAWRRGTVLLCGVEAHVCVLQTALDLQSSGRQCFVATDAVSSSQRDQIGFAYERMTRSGAVLTGVMSAMYELLGDSTNPAFNACLSLAKAVHK
jgi:nicotinamidase-related amidase